MIVLGLFLVFATSAQSVSGWRFTTVKSGDTGTRQVIIKKSVDGRAEIRLSCANTGEVSVLVVLPKKFPDEMTGFQVEFDKEPADIYTVQRVEFAMLVSALGGRLSGGNAVLLSHLLPTGSSPDEVQRTQKRFINRLRKATSLKYFFILLPNDFPAVEGRFDLTGVAPAVKRAFAKCDLKVEAEESEQ